MISDAEFDRWGEAAERGDYGGSKGPVMHGPIFPVDADYPDIVSLGVSADMMALVDAKARRVGVGRDDVVRHAIARDLVGACTLSRLLLRPGFCVFELVCRGSRLMKIPQECSALLGYCLKQTDL